MAQQTGTYSNWDFAKYRVQQNVAGGQFINAESTLIAAGHPMITASPATSGGAAAVSQTVYPIGLLETFGLQQSRQLQRIFEIGSSRSYFIPGRTIGSVTIGRTFYSGPNLLRVLYAYQKGTVAGASIGTLMDSATDAEGATGTVIQKEYHRIAGYGNFLIDLASDLFAQPLGLAVYFKDSNHDTYGGFYLENNYVQGHQMTVSSGSVLIMEGASLQYDLLVPIDISATGAGSSMSFSQSTEISSS